MRLELAMTIEDSAAPNRQMPRVFRRPAREERATMSGQQTICAIEKALVDSPTSVGVAPIDCRCNGKVLNAIPSETMRARTESKIGITAAGSLSSSVVGFLEALRADQLLQDGVHGEGWIVKTFWVLETRLMRPVGRASQHR